MSFRLVRLIMLVTSSIEEKWDKLTTPPDTLFATLKSNLSIDAALERIPCLRGMPQEKEECDWNASTDPTKRLKQSRYRLFSYRKYNTMVPR